MFTYIEKAIRKGEIEMTLELTAVVIVVLTAMEMIIGVIFLSQLYKINMYKKLENNAESENVQKRIQCTIWIFAIDMVIKVALENRVQIPKILPVLWWTDMILMNFSVMYLVIKYLKIGNRK